MKIEQLGETYRASVVFNENEEDLDDDEYYDEEDNRNGDGGKEK